MTAVGGKSGSVLFDSFSISSDGCPRVLGPGRQDTARLADGSGPGTALVLFWVQAMRGRLVPLMQKQISWLKVFIDAVILNTA